MKIFVWVVHRKPYLYSSKDQNSTCLCSPEELKERSVCCMFSSAWRVTGGSWQKVFPAGSVPPLVALEDPHTFDTPLTTLFLSVLQVTIIYYNGQMEHESKGNLFCCIDPALTPTKKENQAFTQRTNLRDSTELRRKESSKCDRFSTCVTSGRSLIFCLPSSALGKWRWH